MEKMKQNKNNSVVIRVASATLAAVFLLCSLSITSYADVTSNVSDYSLQPIPTFTTTGVFNSWDSYLLAVEETYASNNQPWFNRYIWNYTPDIDVYAFAVKGSSSQVIYFLSESQFNYGYSTRYEGTASSGNGTKSTLAYIPDDTHIYYWHQYSYNDNDTGYNQLFHIPIYESFDAGQLALTEYLSQGGSGIVAEFNYSIKPGYALFIDIHGLSDVSGNLFTNTSAAYASPHTSNQTLSYQSSLPSGNVSPQGNGINWQGTGNRDLFGRYKSWNRSLIIQPNSHYIAIYNPVHINTYVDPEHEDFNGNISVHVNKAYSETSILIPLNTELTGTGTVGTNTTDEQKPVVYDENTNSWIPQNTDGTPYTESPYGDYMPSTVNSIHDWLQNIANLISGFFNGAIGAVTTLVGAGSAFINQLVSPYSWLPAPVYAVLSSALILVITIGVIKVFI